MRTTPTFVSLKQCVMRKLFLFSLSVLACTLAVAQPAKDAYKKPGVLVIQFGMQDFTTPQRLRSSSLAAVSNDKRWAKFSEQDPALGLSYIKGISNHFDYSVNYFLAAVNYPFRDATPRYSSEHPLQELDASIHMKLLPDNFVVVPYLSAGVGVSAFKGGRFDAFMPLGLGLQFALSPEVFAFTNFQYRIPVTERANYHFLSSLGIGTTIGKKKEPEVVPPPPPPPPVVVAPKDTDGDGITDDQDKCPTVAGVLKYQGCPIPDTDGDGINDDADKCPTVKGLAKYQGCPIPDTDGDGINDEEDKCPTVAGLARYQGCPIPDSDGDGVNDEVDKCPSVPGVAANYGCPPINFTPEKITFQIGSAVLTAAGKKELNDNVLPPLQQFGDAVVEIHGHTDNTGNAASNQRLSERRAAAVKAYLVTKGIAAERLITKGFGQTAPVGDNKTAAGRSKNRRVDFKLVE